MKWLKRLLLVIPTLLLLECNCDVVYCQVQVQSWGQGPANIYSVNGSVGTTHALVTFTAPSGHIRIVNLHASQSLYVAFDGTNDATTSNFAIPGGNLDTSMFAYDGSPLAAISVIGSGSSTTYSIAAW